MEKRWEPKPWQLLLTLSSLLWTSSGCAHAQQLNTSPPQQQVQNILNSQPKIPDQGDIRIVHVPPQNNLYEPIAQALQDSLEFSAPQDPDGLITQLNAKFALPRDLTVSFQECGESNEFYDPEQVKIEICYELLHQYVDIFGVESPSPNAFTDEVIYAALFTFFHELGHAFVDQLQLPITGLEENVVDEFAAIMLLELQDDDAVIAGMDQFDADAEEDKQLRDLPFWDSHGLSAQRYYTVACIIYGSDPQGFADFVTSGDLPAERAKLCPVDYQRRERSWKFLLAPYRKSTRSHQN